MKPRRCARTAVAVRFHAHTLKLYRAICSHGNHHAAHELTNYVDELQLMYCLKSKCNHTLSLLFSSVVKVVL